MHNKGRKNLHKYLMQAASADDVIHNHAYGKVAKKHKPIPKRRPSGSGSGSSTVASYRDSMVGSTVQYHHKTPVGPIKPDEHTPPDTAQDQDIIGNRPRSNVEDKPTDAQRSIERRRHFIEPPKRNFHRFD